MKEKINIGIVGAGPAGFGAADYLVEKLGERLAQGEVEIEIFEKGKTIDERICPRVKAGKCIACNPCNAYQGVAGAGLGSDGKLLLHTRIGNNLNEVIPEEKNQELVDRSEIRFKTYGAIMQEQDDGRILDLRTRALQNGIDFEYSRQAHIGSDRLPEQMKNFQKFLEAKGVKFTTQREIKSLEELSDKDYVLLAPGRGGSRWLESVLREINVGFGYRPVDMGVRVEVPKEIIDAITDVTRDMKFYVRSKTFNDLVRTFCTCPGGFVTQESHDDFNLVNGYSVSGKGSSNTNFAVLARVPLEDSNTNNYAALIAQLGYILRDGKKITAQRFGDLKRGRKSKSTDNHKYFLKKTLKEAEWGDISLILDARHFIDIMEGLDAFNKIMPGLTNDSTLLYTPEIKFHGLKIKTNEYLRAAPRIYVAGDGAGFSRGIIGAFVSGNLAAEGIYKEIQK